MDILPQYGLSFYTISVRLSMDNFKNRSKMLRFFLSLAVSK